MFDYTYKNIDPKTEIRSKRKERSKTFRLPDGKLRHLCFGAPIHYRTPVGEGERPEFDEFDDIDIRLQLVESATKDFNSYLALKNKFTYGFRDDGKAEKYIGIRRGADNQMEWSLIGVKLGLTDKAVPTTYTSAEKVSDFQFKHVAPDYEVITDFNEIHIRTAIKATGVTDFLLQEYIDLTGITVTNKKTKDGEYIPDVDNRFNFLTTDGEPLWIPTPKMWTEDIDAPVSGSQEITHRLFEQGGKLIYEKTPTEKGKVWLASVDGVVYIDGDTYTGATGDGYIQYSGAANWDEAHDAATGTAYFSTGTLDSVYVSSTQIRRFHLFFDTSGMTYGAESCSLYFYALGTVDESVCAQLSTISGTSVSSTAHYSDFSGSEYGHISSPSATAWNNIPFNSTGIANVNKDGYTKVSFRSYAHDYLDSDPSGESYTAFYQANNATNKPYLDIVELSPPAAPTNVSATDGTHTDKVVVTWTKSSGATGYKVYRGATLCDTLGDVATYDDMGADAPVITPGAAVASDGSSTAQVALSISGESVANGTSHSYTVKAVNAYGDSAASSANTGYRGHGTLTYQWQRSAGDSDASYGNISGATTESYNDTDAPADGSGRYFKCVLNATGAASQTTTADRGYRLVQFIPIIIIM